MTQAMSNQGFSSITFESQAAFRTLLAAMASPGEVCALSARALAPPGLSLAQAVVLLTLADFDTPVWMPRGLAQSAGQWLAFQTGAPLAASPFHATFAVWPRGADDLRLKDLNPGEDRYPDRSTTLIVECESFHAGAEVVLEGPGIKGARAVAPCGLPPAFWREWQANHAGYPLGVDVFLTSGAQVMALPRSTAARMKVENGKETIPCMSR